MPLPKGLKIGSGKFRVGKKLGSGACATVHAVELSSDGSETEWAIKLAPKPAKTTKKGNSPGEANYRHLHYENIVYQNTVPDLQGKLVPRLPPGTGKAPPSHGEVDGKQSNVCIFWCTLSLLWLIKLIHSNLL